MILITYLTKYDSFNSYDNFLIDTSIPRPNNNWLIYILSFIYFSSNAVVKCSIVSVVEPLAIIKKFLVSLVRTE